MATRPPAELLGLAERARRDDWTLRSALVRYAQPEPQRASAVLELVRRIDGALAPHARTIETGDDVDDTVRGVLDAAARLDDLAEILTAWAIDVARPQPDAEVDTIAREVFTALGALGVPRETRPPRRS